MSKAVEIPRELGQERPHVHGQYHGCKWPGENGPKASAIMTLTQFVWQNLAQHTADVKNR